MKISFNLTLRPSSIVRGIENAVIGAGSMVATAGAAVGRRAQDFGHGVRVEYRARALARAAALSTAVRDSEAAERAEIQARLDELLNRRGNVVVHVPAPQGTARVVR